MDRKSITGLVLIAGIMIVFAMFNKPDEKENKKNSEKGNKKKTELIEETAEDTLAVKTQDPVIKEGKIDSVYWNSFRTEVEQDSAFISTVKDTSILDSVIEVKTREKYDTYVQKQEKEKANASLKGKYGDFAGSVKGEEKSHILENDYIKIEFSSKGAQVKKVELKKYRSYYAYDAGVSAEEAPLVLIDSTNRFAFNYREVTEDRIVDFWTDELYFKAKTIENVIEFTAKSSNGGTITYRYELTNDKDYELKQDIITSGLNPVAKFESLEWSMKARHNEKSRSQENQVAGVFYKYTEDSRDYLSETGDDEESIEASLDWIAFKQAFFSAVMITKGEIGKGGEMEHNVITSGPYLKKYSAEFEQPGLKSNSTLELTWYLGPNDYDRFAAYDIGMHKIMNHGWKIFGWINRNFFLPLYQWLANFNISHGLIILFMTIIVRLITTPLVFRNYRSSAKMRLLKPEIEQLAKKYPDPKDAMKKQQETMALYRKTGVSPMAGCLPMLIQMPILFAMFRLVPTLLELRQESFLWADDLSSYDAILTWTQDIPLLTSIYGNHISLFTLLMAGSTMAYTMINMNQMSSAQQPGMPNMKFIMYLFPIMMIFFFNNYSAGLSYYYFLSSLLSMAVMLLIKKYFIDEDKLMRQIEENRKKPRKKSRFQQRLEDIQRQQAQKKK